jgi:O-antigen ligase
VKWVFLIIGAALVWPLSNRLRSNPRNRLWLFALAAFLPFVTRYEHYFMAIINWGWPGYVNGGELSYLDLLALAIYLSLPNSKDRLPFLLCMTFYLFATMLSVVEAFYPMAALFYVLQLARVFFLYAVVYRGICADPQVVDAVLTGMGGGLLLEAALATWQRFGQGLIHASGTFSGQNQLGLASHFTIIPFFALMLGGRRGWLPPAVVAAGLIVEVMTTSRGAILFGGLGLATVYVLSALRRWSSRKAQVLLAGVAAAAVFVPLAASSLAQRFGGDSQVNFAEDNERLLFKEAAADMLSDHPMGVGANHFNFVANTQGYFNRVGEEWGPGRASNVHNVYWLVAAETGYLGLVAFVCLLLRPMYVAFASGLRHIGDPRGDLLLGLGVALLVVYLHNFEEWIFIQFDVEYQFALVIGLVAGLAGELGYWRRR